MRHTVIKGLDNHNFSKIKRTYKDNIRAPYLLNCLCYSRNQEAIREPLAKYGFLVNAKKSASVRCRLTDGLRLQRRVKRRTAASTFAVFGLFVGLFIVGLLEWYKAATGALEKRPLAERLLSLCSVSCELAARIVKLPKGGHNTMAVRNVV